MTGVVPMNSRLRNTCAPATSLAMRNVAVSRGVGVLGVAGTAVAGVVRRVADGGGGGSGADGGGSVVSRDDGESGRGGNARTAADSGVAPSPMSSGVRVFNTKKALAAKMTPARTTTRPTRFTPEFYCQRHP